MEVFRYALCALVNISITLIQRSAPWGSDESNRSRKKRMRKKREKEGQITMAPGKC